MALGKANSSQRKDGKDRPAPSWDYPEWKERYDFAVAQRPKKGTERKMAILTNIIESRPMFSLFSGKERYFFTQFNWTDDDGRDRTTSRDDVVKTFLTFLAHWVPVERLSLDLWFLLQEDRVEALQHRPIYAEAKEMLKLLDGPNKKLHHLCGGYGIKLDFLADCEEQCRIPSKWRKHEGPYDIVTLREQPHVRLVRHEGTITDYPFRVAEELKRTGWPRDPEHDALIAEARRVRDQLATAAGLTPHSTVNLLKQNGNGIGNGNGRLGPMKGGSLSTISQQSSGSLLSGH